MASKFEKAMTEKNESAKSTPMRASLAAWRTSSVPNTREWVRSARYVPLRDLETSFPNDTSPYNVSWLAVDRVLAPGSQAPLRGYCERVGNGMAWRTAFAQAFGESIDSFYARFEAYRVEFSR